MDQRVEEIMRLEYALISAYRDYKDHLEELMLARVGYRIASLTYLEELIKSDTWYLRSLAEKIENLISNNPSSLTNLIKNDGSHFNGWNSCSRSIEGDIK